MEKPFSHCCEIYHTSPITMATELTTKYWNEQLLEELQKEDSFKELEFQAFFNRALRMCPDATLVIALLDGASNLVEKEKMVSSRWR